MKIDPHKVNISEKDKVSGQWFFSKEFQNEYNAEIERISQQDIFYRLNTLQQAARIIANVDEKDEH